MDPSPLTIETTSSGYRRCAEEIASALAKRRLPTDGGRLESVPDEIRLATPVRRGSVPGGAAFRCTLCVLELEETPFGAIFRIGHRSQGAAQIEVADWATQMWNDLDALVGLLRQIGRNAQNPWGY